MSRPTFPRPFFQRSSIAFSFLIALLTVTSAARAEDPVSRLLIEPSSTRTSLARCELTVGALECKEQTLSGSYSIKVIPFGFKNDHGSLNLTLSEANASKMAHAEAVEFSGLATSARDGKTKPIKGKTKPESGDHGLVTFTVTTEDGDLLFNSTYRINPK